MRDCRLGAVRSGRGMRWQGLPGDETPNLILSDLPQPLEVLNLLFEVIFGSVEPKPAAGSTMNSERPSDRVSEFTRTEFIVLWKNLDPFRQPVSFHRDSKAQRQVVDVDPALTGQERCIQENP